MSDILDLSFWLNYGVNESNLKIYLDFIKNIKSYDNRNLDYSESHHIVPKCVDISLSKDINNIIELSGAEHLKAHRLLTNCFSDGKLTIKMCYTYKRMTESVHKNKYNISEFEYEESKRLFSESMRGENNPGRNLSEESIRKMSKTQKERLADPTKNPMYGRDGSKSNNPIYGKIAINNGINNKFIYESELDYYINAGWKRGSKQNHRGQPSPMKGRKLAWVNNGIIEKHIDISQCEDYIKIGWVKGRLFHESTIKNKVKITNGQINKFVYSDELESYFNSGYVLWKNRNILK